MRKVILYIAVSLDGYIADRNGGIGWLERKDAGDSYEKFVRGVETVIMGWNTYGQIVTELSPKEWPYTGLKSYVVTHREPDTASEVFFTDECPGALVERLKQEEGHGIWICGGADLVQQVEHVIDIYHLSLIPVMLGSGIRLFKEMGRKKELCLLETRTRKGIVEQW